MPKVFFFPVLLAVVALPASALPLEHPGTEVPAHGKVVPVQDWVPFHNDRYGFSVDIPAGLQPLPPPENGDGRTFTSSDGRATVLAYGHLFVDVSGLVGDERNEEEMSAKGGLNVTYRQVSARATTFSGLQGGIIVYQRAIATCKGTASAIVHAEYPASEKARFDPIVAHMAKTLRGSNRCWSPG